MRLALALLPLCSSGVSRQIAREPPAVLDLTLAPTDARTCTSEVRSVVTARHAGLLYVQASSTDFDPWLRAERGGVELARDHDSGGGTTAWLEIAVESDDAIELVVGAQDGGSGAFELRLEPLYETEATAALAAGVEEDLRSCRELAAAARHAEAQALLANAVELAVAAVPPVSAGRLRALRALDRAVQELGAEPLRLRVLRAIEELDAALTVPAHPRRIDDLFRIANELRRTDPAAALPLFVELAERVDQAFPRTSARHHMCALGRAGALARLGSIEDARAIVGSVVEACGTAALDDEGIQVLKACAGLLVDLGEARTAIAICRRILDGIDDRHRLFPHVRMTLGRALYHAGELVAARAEQEGIVAALADVLPEDDVTLLDARESLGVTLWCLGDDLRALEQLRAVLAQRSRRLPPDHSDILSARVNMGLVLRDVGQAQEAVDTFREVVTLLARRLPAADPSLMRARQNLADALLVLGWTEEAATILEPLLTLREEVLPADAYETATTRLALAIALLSRGDLERARTLLVQTGATLERTLAPDHVYSLGCRQRLAQVLLELGRTEEVERRTVELASILRAALLANAIAHSPPEAERGIGHYSSYVSHVLTMAQRPAPSSGVLEDSCFNLVETARASGLFAAWAMRRGAADPEVESLRERMSAKTTEIVALTSRPEHHAALADAVQERDRVQRELLARLQPTFRNPMSGDGLTPERVARSLGTSDTALLAFRSYGHKVSNPLNRGMFFLTRQLLAFVVRPGRPCIRVDLGLEGLVETQVRAWHSALAHARTSLGRGLAVGVESATSDESESGVRIREQLLDPLLPYLEGITRLVIVPDSIVHRVPFEALPIEAELVGDRWRVEYRTTAWELLLEEEPAPQDGTLLAIGGLDYDAAAPVASAAAAPVSRGGKRRFDPLPATAREVTAIADLFRQTSTRLPVVLQGRQGTPQALVAGAPASRYLHVATHGLVLEEAGAEDPKPSQSTGPAAFSSNLRATPLTQCAIALAGANSSGLITGEELSMLDLGNCELAVLSACESNVGKMTAGQGIDSLQKALRMAGARSVITALWEVPDEWTMELMVRFYRNLWIEGLPTARALWNAKCELRRMGASTRDWGAWVLTGE